MKCTVCGAELHVARTDLPFKVRATGIVILKSLPVLQCGNCPEYLIEDAVLTRVDEILASAGSQAELEIIRYAARARAAYRRTRRCSGPAVAGR